MLSSRTFLKGSASYIVRLALAFLVGLVLPPVLVRHLSQAEYSSWVLILQMGTYVNMLDLGLQTVVAKLIAEHNATNNREAGRLLVSSAFSVLSLAAVAGIVVTLILVWRVPYLFHQMPTALLPQVRLSLLFVGASFAFLLPFSPFLAVFTGLQEYGLPTAVNALSRFLAAILLIILALHHAGLVAMAIAMAGVNVMTACAQYYGWKRFASDRFRFTFFLMERKATLHLLRSGGVITIWTLGGLFVSGLDTVIVGHFDYASTGFYAIAVTATNLMIYVVGSLFAPLLPSVSAMQATSTPDAVGDVTIRATRYCTLILCLLGLPLLVGAFPLLSIWVGQGYAAKTAIFLQVLVLGNLVRQMGYPYAVVVMATGNQHLATVATVAEAVVNFALSIWLAQRMGAIGVALGTLAGAFVSLGLHLILSMRLTQTTIALSRIKFILQALLRPLLSTLPLLILLPTWHGNAMIPANPVALVLWLVATLLVLYLAGLTSSDREHVRRILHTYLQRGVRAV